MKTNVSQSPLAALTLNALRALGEESMRNPKNYITLFNQIQNGDEKGQEEARNLLALQFICFAFKCAHKFGENARLPIEERVAIALLALTEAAQAFDPNRSNANFLSTAFLHIRKALIEGSIHSRLVNPTTSTKDRTAFFNLSRALQKLSLSDKASLTSDQLKQVVTLINEGVQTPEKKTTPEHVLKEFNRRRHYDVSLDQPHKEGDKTLADTIPGTMLPPEEIVAQEQEAEYLQDALQRAMNSLDERQQYILRVRILNPDGDKENLVSLAERFKVSAERIRQIEKSALEKLRKCLEGMGITSASFTADSDDVFSRPAVDPGLEL